MVDTWTSRVTQSIRANSAPIIPYTMSAQSSEIAEDALLFMLRWVFGDPSVRLGKTMFQFGVALPEHFPQRDQHGDLTTKVGLATAHQIALSFNVNV